MIDELPGEALVAFTNWASGRNDFEILDVSIDLEADTTETRRLGVGKRAGGKFTQLGDASLKWLEEDSQIISNGQVRVLTNNTGLINWGQKLFIHLSFLSPRPGSYMFYVCSIWPNQHSPDNN